MNELHPQKANLLVCIELEMKEQENRFSLSSALSLKQLKSEGVVIHPLRVVRKSFGYADYPEIEFKLPFAQEYSQFRENSPIECFIEGEEPVKGVLIHFDGKSGAFRLFAPDFPDWIESHGVGLKRVPDQYTGESMKKAILSVSEHPRLEKLFSDIHGVNAFGKEPVLSTENALEFVNERLNESQKNAIHGIVSSDSLTIVHGPPGTGKTTTILEAIRQLVKQGQRVLVAAPSNAAVDHVAKGLIGTVELLRLGNTVKVDEQLFPYTMEGKLQGSRQQKEIKRLKIQAEELRRMAHQYKRNFGKAEREQRNLLFREVKRLRKEIRELRSYASDQLFDRAEVVVGTPIGLYNELPKNALFDTFILDESGQALEPLAWLIFPYAKSWVLAGDQFQLPPTVLSKEAVEKGFDLSILEHASHSCANQYFLDTQYRMRASIAAFSSEYFYSGKLKTPEYLSDNATHLVFYDTAGTGFEEELEQDGGSLTNQGELSIVQKILESQIEKAPVTGIISPYSGQVQNANDQLSKWVKARTIDSFQGQEKEVIVLSLVRSNSEGNIGFLKDYRRMNVAMTRAQEQLIVIGDSSTIGLDPFYAAFLRYVEEINGYRSAWEWMD